MNQTEEKEVLMFKIFLKVYRVHLSQNSYNPGIKQPTLVRIRRKSIYSLLVKILIYAVNV